MHSIPSSLLDDRIDERASADGEGWGGVWPLAVLLGSTTAMVAGAGAWLGATFAGAERPWSFWQWTAEHALWGTVTGAGLTLVLRAMARRVASLREPAPRRAAAARAVTLGVGGGVVLLALLSASDLGAALGPLSGMLAALGAWVMLLAALRRGPYGAPALPRLDPTRVAVLIAVLTLPWSQGRSAQASVEPRPAAAEPTANEPLRSRSGPAETLPAAWRCLLGR